MKISLIVTVYNRLKYLKYVINSLKNQTHQIDELIIADDGSSEKVVEFIGEEAKTCSFKIVHSFQEDKGFRLARSRNMGAKIATGDYLIFIDQDLILPDDFIKKIVKNSNKKKMVFTRAKMSLEHEKEAIEKEIEKGWDYSRFYIHAKRVSEKEITKYANKDKVNSILYKLKLRTRGAKIAGLMFSLYKEDFMNINGFDENYNGWGHEDDDFCNRFFAYGGDTISVKLNEYPIHMYHPFDPTKKDSPNKEYYQKRKKEILSGNWKHEFGVKNHLEKDEVKVTKLN